jgi:hypothetical protein
MDLHPSFPPRGLDRDGSAGMFGASGGDRFATSHGDAEVSLVGKEVHTYAAG